jgi:hypothetical protein
MKDSGPKGGPLTITKMFKRTQEAKLNQTHDPMPKTRPLEVHPPANLASKVTMATPTGSLLEKYKYTNKSTMATKLTTTSVL